MSKRILVAVIAVPLFLLVIIFAPVWALGALMGIIAALGAYELLGCTVPDMNFRRQIIVMAAALAIPLWSSLFDPGKVAMCITFLLFAVMLGEMIFSFYGENIMPFGDVAYSLFAGAVIPILLTSVVRLAQLENGAAFALLPFVAAWCSDSGAYFAGIFMGRHKLAPALSPNKTIEGSIGGILSSVIFMLLFGLILKLAKFDVNFLVLGVYGFLGSLACQLGDFSFSAIKRQTGIKDFGTLLPGHGGILDRFDGLIWTAALIELLVAVVPAIVKIAETV